MSLYDLPKEMLIKLITTIEENTIKKYEEIMSKRIVNLIINKKIDFQCPMCARENEMDLSVLFKNKMIADVDGAMCYCDWLWYCENHWQNVFDITPQEEGNYNNCVVCTDCENRDNTKHISIIIKKNSFIG